MTALETAMYEEICRVENQYGLFPETLQLIEAAKKIVCGTATLEDVVSQMDVDFSSRVPLREIAD